MPDRAYKIKRMARLIPFRAYRYDPEKVGDLNNVVSQPYDKVTTEMREQYLQRSPHNIVRVIKNTDYAQAGRQLREWIDQAILVQDPHPSFYPYQQTFDFQGETFSRLGLIALISLEDPELTMKGHENVLTEPLEDRLSLIRQTEANEGLIFSLFSQPDLEVDRMLRHFSRGYQADVELTDEYGVIHRLWVLSDPRAQDQVGGYFKNRTLYIADGHHRFQTSLVFHRECIDKGWSADSLESFDKRMIALFNMDHPSLKILATHRAVHNLQDLELGVFLSQLSRYFSVEETPTLENLEKAMQEEGHVMGMVTSDRLILLRLKEECLKDSSFMEGVSGPARELDVTILHEGILRPLLGIGAEELASQQYVSYHRDVEEAAGGVAAGRHQVVFLLKPTTLEQVRQISELGEKMPQKSTDFYPKLLSGLTIMKMEIKKE
jgi:uncharacterized protein (DUF1015 family)